MKHAFIILAIVSGVAFSQLSSACSRPSPPELPDPSTAVTPQMIKAKNDVKAYIETSEKYLKCNISNAQHNSMVDEMKDIADQFNKAVRAYKARMAG